MTSDDLFTIADKNKKSAPAAATKTPIRSNVPEMSVSELATGLKKTLEETYSRIRIRGELTGLKLAASGHLYGDIKDENAVVNIVCWRGTMSRLSLRPEDGMDVIVTGKVSSYPKSSRYQIIIESIELAGEGALLKLLEERRKKLAAEGLFDTNRKKPLPFLPEVIGVVTSPSGAVIRDIMHRLRDRFPRRVLLWPVIVQGDGAAEQIAQAIDGFNRMEENGETPRPDLIIVARGGGSLEDLMAFNEENVVRAAANSTIPLISAVGHETDTTLIDYASDVRAPTPTGAAEMAVPVRLNLIAQLQEDHQRLIRGMKRQLNDQKNILSAHASKLGNPQTLLDIKSQSLDIASEKLTAQTRAFIHNKQLLLQRTASRLLSPQSLITHKKQALQFLNAKLTPTLLRTIEDKTKRLNTLWRILENLSPQSVLSRGYALVYDDQGNLIRETKQLEHNQDIVIEFADKNKLKAITQKK